MLVSFLLALVPRAFAVRFAARSLGLVGRRGPLIPLPVDLIGTVFPHLWG